MTAWSLAPSSHPLRDVVDLCRSALVWLALSGALVACVPTSDHPDAGHEDAPPGDGSAFAAAARVRLPHEALEVGDVTVSSFALRIASLRLVSDRGVAFDPVRAGDLGPVDLASSTTIEFPSIPPASYSAAVIVLDGAAAVLEIDAEDAVLGRVHVSYGSRVEWMARCSAGVPVGVGETLDVGVDLDLGPAWEDLRSADLPDPSGGVLSLDESTAPEAVAELVRAIGEALRAECDLDTP